MKPTKFDVRLGRESRVPLLLVEGVRHGIRFDPPARTLVEFRHAAMTAVDLSRTRFDNYAASDTVFSQCDFRHARINAGILGADAETVYRDCRFDSARLAGVDALFARFERCTFDNANIKGLRAVSAEFVECHFAGRVEQVAFAGTPDPRVARAISSFRTTNEFRGNDFREAELIDCMFIRGIDMATQLWPASDSYVRLDHLRERLLRARAEVARWQDNSSREEALSMLRTYEPVSRTQDELFARRDDIKMPTEIRDRVWEILSRPLD